MVRAQVKAQGPNRGPADSSGQPPGRLALTSRWSQWRRLGAAAVLVVAVLAAYSNSLTGPFIFDDRDAILKNGTIEHLWPIWPVLLPPANGSAVQRRPVVNLSLAVNYALSGYDVWSYHALNLLAHLAAALLLFGIARRTLLLPRWQERWAGAATPLALTIALLWAVHPLLTEAVTYVVQRTEVLAGLFYLMTLYCLIRGAGSPRGWPWYAGAVAACALAQGSKEAAVSAPLVALLYDRVFLSPSWREVLRRRWGLYLGLAASWGVILPMLPRGSEGAAVFTAPQNADVVRILGEPCRTIDYTLAQFGVIAHYLRLCFWPHPLVADYGLYAPQTAWQIAPYALLIGGLLAATLAAFRYQPWLGFLGVWFFAVLAPSSSVVPLFQQVAAEKRMYLPLAAVVAAVVTGGYLAGRGLIAGGLLSLRTARIGGGSLTALAALALAGLAFHRNTAYRDTITIWQDVVDKMPDNARAHNNLGIELMRCGRPDDALKHCQEAVRLKPDYAEGYSNLGNVLTNRGRLSEAIECYRKALKLKPDYANAHCNLGTSLLAAGRPDEAIRQYRAALQLNPYLVEAYYNLGSVLAAQAQFQAAVVQYRNALRLNPGLAAAYNALARLLATCPEVSVRNGPEAVDLARQAVALTHACDPAALDTLATAYAETGRFPQAIWTAQQAASLAAQLGKPELLDLIQARIRLYRAGAPYREMRSAPTKLPHQAG